MTFKQDLKKKEFLTKTGLAEYSNTLFLIIDRILEDGCEISCDDRAKCSRCSQRTDDLNIADHIYIGFGRPREKPLHFAWEMLHEFGHHLSGKPRPVEDGTLAREELAWDYAEKELTRYPDLAAQIDDFITYRKFCLDSYRNPKRKQCG
jgi:hypothetical protein